MSPRVFPLLVLVCSGAGFAAGTGACLAWGDRCAARPAAGAAAAARAELGRVRTALDEAHGAALRRAFLARYPHSWLRAHWERHP